ncbi:uncharacterized protein PAC_06152 [Phialocephala subalpina]|uniref:Hydrophobin n=1 Tax=Phialocephala subalpina TaxID=576137 RepID=A0A1L7WU02_9HELO|nr:uncharacterized protein PAC_06152 [Phialocephala subalpina]
MYLPHLFITLFLLAVALAQPAQNPRDFLGAIGSAASGAASGAAAALKQPSSTAAAAPPPPPPPQVCTCTVVFGNKGTTAISNATVGSTIGLTGQDKKKQACSADLLVGTGCISSTTNESSNSCVTSSTCTVA